MSQLLLPLPDAWRALGIGRSKLYQLIAAGDLKTVKIGKRCLVPVVELERYAASLMEAA